MSTKYLDENGVARLWAKIKERDNNIINNATVNAAYKDGAGNTISTTYINVNQKGINNGVATLGADGKVPSTQLPSYVDDVLEYNNRAAFPATGESGKIYVAKDNNKTYRWSGSTYVEISPSIVIGTTTGTAYDGGKGRNLEVQLSTVREQVEEKLDKHSEVDQSPAVRSCTLANNNAEFNIYTENPVDSVTLDATFSDGGFYIEATEGDNAEYKSTLLFNAGGLSVNDHDVLDTSKALTNAEIDAILV